MKKYLKILKNTAMFSGISEEEIGSMLSCLGARLITYKKGEFVFRQGEEIGYITLLAEGSLLVQQDDYWGNRSILGKIEVGDLFGEAYIAKTSGPILNDVIAQTDSAVIFFDVLRVMTTCSAACSFHSAVIKNLFFAISEKNRSLVRKLSHISKRSTREKLISYLSDEAKKQESSEIVVPFSRQQLADFLSVDRSAMSKELSKMRDEGLILFNKNRFSLL
ncbi:MAG: Crp/Fnr family transcriptional regulator [Clostridia bacterium]|nr:Crp/Fnr family transcriptional regulator [Clostridia bacterium]